MKNNVEEDSYQNHTSSSSSSSSSPRSSDVSSDNESTRHNPQPSISAIAPAPPASLHAWVDIMAASKLVLLMTPRSLSNPHIMIQHAQKEFLLNFGFSEDQLPLPLAKLFGPSTERTKISRLQQCLLTGRSFSEFINLHKSNGGSLSCYISLLCLTNQTSSQSQSLSLPGGEGFADRDREVVKYGVLTVRSASVVGNSKHSGIGLMGTERVPRERMQSVPSAATNNTNNNSRQQINTSTASLVKQSL